MRFVNDFLQATKIQRKKIFAELVCAGKTPRLRSFFPEMWKTLEKCGQFVDNFGKFVDFMRKKLHGVASQISRLCDL